MTPIDKSRQASQILVIVLTLSAGIVLGLSSSAQDFLLAILINRTVIMIAIGLYPLVILVQVHRKRLRFGLADLCAAILCFGWTLVPLNYLLQRCGYPLREFPAFFLYVEIMIGVGFLGALKNRNMLQDRVVALRWLIFIATLIAPATALPALLGIIGMVFRNELFHNDWLAMLSWLALVAPVLIATWFSAIHQIAASEEKEQARE